MSLLNVWLDNERALVGVDTDALAPGGVRVRVNKIMLLPTLNAVLAGRGAASLLGCVYVQLMALPQAADFDFIAAALPELVEKAFDQIRGPLRNEDPATYRAAHEIVLVGWSPKLGRMRAIEVVRPAGGSAFTVEETEKHYIAPWDEKIKSAPDPTDIHSMAELAVAQVALIRGAYPNAAAGGQLIVAELREVSMVLRTVCGLT